MGKDDLATAHHSLIDPLYEPDPSDETGLNSHFRSTFAPLPNQSPTPRQDLTPPRSAGHKDSAFVDIGPQHTGTSVETNPYRRARASSAATKSHSTVHHYEATPSPRHNAYPSPPHSASPRKGNFTNDNYRAEAFGSVNPARGPNSRPRRSSQPPAYTDAPKRSAMTRSGSLRERYPGDRSHRPLDVLRQDTKKAHRAPHLRKKNFAGADLIDRLDASTFSYHHEGPFDAANASRNFDYKHSPIAAVQGSNEEALRATPREAIIDAVTKHRPLEGVANIPPGVPDRFGRVLDYEEGADLQREPGGDYRRWPGVDYLPGDLKGKGEPSYSVDEALRNHKRFGDSGTEMTRRRNQSLGGTEAPESVPLQSPFDDHQAVGRSNTTGKSVTGSLKKTFGSLRRRKVDA